MKSLLMALILIAIVFGTQSQAKAPHEKVITDSIYDMNQYGKIKASYLNALDMEIFRVQSEMNKEFNSLEDTTDMTEGKIRASLENMILKKLDSVKKKRIDLEGNNDIVDADVLPIYKELEEIMNLVEEINP